MIRKLKVFGPAVLAVCALGAMGVSASSAAQFTTTSGATITGTQGGTHKFLVTGQEVTCSSVLFHGTAPAAAFEAITISPQYTNCKTALGTTVTITGFEHLQFEKEHSQSTALLGKYPYRCGFILRSSGSFGVPTQAIAELECANGAEVTIDAGPCVVHIPAQGFDAGINYENNASGSKKDIGFVVELLGITANHTDGFLCPFGGAGHDSSGVLRIIGGTLIAEVSGSQVDLSFDL